MHTRLLRRSGMRSLTLVLALAMAVAALGCGGTSKKPDGGDELDGCQGGQRLLSVVGDPNLTLYPQESVDLKVVFLEQCVGAVAGEAIQFEIIGNPGDSSLSAPTATTEPNGLAKVTLTTGDMRGLFQVRAHHPDDPDGVYFSINLKPVSRQVYPVGPTSLTAYTGESIDLTVKLVNVDTNSPINGFDIAFAITQPAPGDASIPTPVDNTNLSGLATATFMAGTTVTTYQATATGASIDVGSVTFTVQVKSRTACVNNGDCPRGQDCVNGACVEPAGDECTNDDQCPEGYACEEGYCRPEGTLPDSCDSSEDCPVGYYCENHRCYPCDEGNQLPECQAGGDGCQTDADCPPGFVCINGVCYPDNPDDVVIPELGGRWYTEHYFNIRDALPDFAATIAGAISWLNQALNYCDITGIGFIDDLLCDVIGDYVPDWVLTLIDILDNLGNMLSELRAEGVMDLTHLNPRELLSATEQWNKIMLRYLNACCEGQPPGCNPYNQPGFPDCATIDISRQDLSFAEVGLQVLPFTAKVDVDDSGAFTVYTLAVDERQVKIEFSKFVSFLLDLLIQIFTPYDDLNDALTHLIDCAAIQDFVEGVFYDWGLDFGGLFSPPDVESACVSFLPNAADLIGGLLNQIGFGWKLLKFDGWATITTLPGNPPYATELGYDNYEQGGDGTWDGTFNIIFDADITGAWHGER